LHRVNRQPFDEEDDLVRIGQMCHDIALDIGWDLTEQIFSALNRDGILGSVLHSH
jgi:hypothetical protein